MRGEESPSVAAGQAGAGSPSSAEAREQRFLYLLRTYPERPPDVTLSEVARLCDQGPFAEHDRALFWLGSARLALGDRAAARSWFARLGREHPDSIWVERSRLGLAEASAMERNFGDSLRWYGEASRARDPAVRELARIATPQILLLRLRQRIAWACAVGFALGLAGLLASTLRAALRAGAPIRSALLPPPEARILLPLLAVLALASLRQDAPARYAALELCLSGGILVWLSGARLRALSLGLPGRVLHALGLLVLLGCGAYVAIWRHDLVGMVQETWRAGPD